MNWIDYNMGVPSSPCLVGGQIINLQPSFQLSNSYLIIPPESFNLNYKIYHFGNKVSNGTEEI